MFLRCLTVLLLGVGIADQPQMQPQLGSICGSVQDENGQPAVDTKLAAMYMGPQTGAMSGGKTDSQGHYCVQDLPLGEYQVSADDADKGYPDLSALFFAPYAPQRRVTLTAIAPEAHVDVHIPYKAGFLNLLVVDSGSGKPLSSMSLTLAVRTDPDHRWMSGSTGSDRALLIPPNEDVYLNVTSPEYGTWPDDGSQGMLLTFLPGEKQTVRVRLRKLR